MFLHVREGCVLRVRRLSDGVRVEVTDSSPATPPSVIAAGDDLASGTGRWLVLVEALADRMGVESSGAGKTVWFEVRA